MNSSVARQLRELDTFTGSGAVVLTVYLNAGIGTARDALQDAVERLVRPLHQALDEEDRTELRIEVAVIRDYLGSLVCSPTALALFSCTRRRFFRVVRLPTAVVPVAFWSAHPETGQLHDAVDRMDGGDRVTEDRLMAAP